MALTLFYHPLSSFCHKVLVALYENATPFQPALVNFGDPEAEADFRKLWPVRKFPLLRHDETGRLVPESTTIIEYLALHHPGPVVLVPTDAEAALDVRQWDRFMDLEIHIHMQKIVGDRLRPEGAKDPTGVEHARAAMRTAYGILEERMAGRDWIAAGDFSMADCAACPALSYAEMTEPFVASHPNLGAYLDRLRARPSFARVLEEAAPYLHMMPKG